MHLQPLDYDDHSQDSSFRDFALCLYPKDNYEVVDPRQIRLVLDLMVDQRLIATLALWQVSSTPISSCDGAAQDSAGGLHPAMCNKQSFSHALML